MPDNREWATIILATVLVLAVVLYRPTRRSIPAVLAAAFVPRLVLLWVFYLAYSGTLLWLAWKIGLWRPSMTWAVVLVVFFAGLPMLWRAMKAGDARVLSASVFGETLGVSALVGLYVSLAPFSLPVELLLQVLGAVFAMLRVYAAHFPQYTQVRRICDGFLGTIGVIALWHTTSALIAGMSGGEWATLGLTAALSVWFPIALLPFLYVLTYTTATESAVARVRIGALPTRTPKRRWFVLLLVAFRFRLSYASGFNGHWGGRLAHAGDKNERRTILREYRRQRTASLSGAIPLVPPSTT